MRRRILRAGERLSRIRLATTSGAQAITKDGIDPDQHAGEHRDPVGYPIPALVAP
jgi:hypothetical protein